VWCNSRARRADAGGSGQQDNHAPPRAWWTAPCHADSTPARSRRVTPARCRRPAAALGRSGGERLRRRGCTQLSISHTYRAWGCRALDAGRLASCAGAGAGARLERARGVWDAGRPGLTAEDSGGGSAAGRRLSEAFDLQ